MSRCLSIRTLVLSLALPAAALAHGINGHVWVSDKGIDRLAACERELRDAFADPLIREKFQFGAAFPDSGYVPGGQRDYGEAIHWEPLIQIYIEYLREKYDDRYDSPEAMAEVAFLLGAAQHGMEDEVFDSIFMPKAEEVDGAVQDDLDTGTDFVLVGEGYTDLTPEIYYPQDITTVFARAGISVDTKTIDNAVRIVRTVVIGLVEATPEGLGQEYYETIPWALDNYLDPDVPGGHAFEQHLVAPYAASIWHRLHGELLESDLIVGSAPRADARLPANRADSVDSWVTVFFGIGLMTRSLTADSVRVVDAIGQPVEVEVGWTRWSGPDDDTRLVQIRPVTDWADDAEYVATFAQDIERIDGGRLEVPLSVRFRTACAEGRTCEPLSAAAEVPPCVQLPEKDGRCGIVAPGTDPWAGWLSLLLACAPGLLVVRRSVQPSVQIRSMSRVGSVSRTHQRSIRSGGAGAGVGPG